MSLDLDRAGSFTSVVCAIHCAVSGLAVGVFSSAGLAFMTSEAVEIAFMSIAGLVGLWAMVSGYRLHRSYVPSLLFAIGVLLLAMAHQLEAWYLSVLAGAVLVGYHFMNHRLMNRSSRSA